MFQLFVILFLQILNGYTQSCIEDFQRKEVNIPNYGWTNCITYHELNCTNIDSFFLSNNNVENNYHCKNFFQDKIIKFRITTEIPENITSSYFEKSCDTFQYRELHLTNLKIINIIPGAFNKVCDNLNYLYLDNNNMKIIREGVFNSLTDLKVLSLECNKIELVGEHAFSGLSNLADLNLKNNLITHLYENLFYSLKNLYFLDISQNLINTENYLNCRFSNISKYFIGHNKINHLKNLMFNNISTVNTMDLSYNNISDIEPYTFSKLKNLSDLNLNNNKLVTLSSSLHYLVNLTKLDLSYNNLQTISLGFFDHFNNLTALNLTHNNLVSVYGFTVLNVDYLGLAYNKIKDFNEKTLKSFPHLKTISLDGNQWKCKILIGVVQELSSRLIVLEKGHERIEDNAFGIKCSKTESEKSDNAIESNETNKETFDVRNASIFRYFDEDFKKSNFFKFLNSFQNGKNSTSILQDNLPINTKVINNYLNDDILKTNFVKFLNNTNMPNVAQNKLVYVLNTSMARFFDNFNLKLNEILKNKNISPAKNNTSILQDMMPANTKAINNYLNNDILKTNFVKFLNNSINEKVYTNMHNAVQNQLVYVLNTSMARFFDNFNLKLNEIFINKNSQSTSYISPAHLVTNNTKQLETTPIVSILIIITIILLFVLSTLVYIIVKLLNKKQLQEEIPLN